MSVSLSTSQIFERLVSFVSNQDFLKSRNIGNEIGFYIFDYDPEEELLVRSCVKKFSKKICEANQVKVVVVNIYEKMIESLKNEQLLEEFLTIDSNEGTHALVSQLSPLLEVDFKDKNNFMALIKNDIKDADLVFITGVGTVWPLIRSHIILNNLQATVGSTPVILFLPGSYDKTKLQLFNSIQSNNYYRAFRIKDLIH